ncbi:hypothetical protein FRC08_004139 [Ceratobasidium sp. 394]|nr:hypothetical protein FRC08_004139 [Ceratobasidium sp. 394]
MCSPALFPVMLESDNEIFDFDHSGSAVGEYDPETHVLLAACKNTEVTHVIRNMHSNRGQPLHPDSSSLFTAAFLRALWECDLATTSYTALLRRLRKHVADWVSSMDQNRNRRYRVQTPHCEGREQDRLLFRTQFASHQGMIRLYSNPTGNTLYIKVGSACGTLKGTELDVYSGNIPGTSPPLVRLVVIEATATEATLSIHTTDPMSIDLPLNSHAAAVKYTGQEVRIRIDNVLKLSRLWQEVINALQSQPIDIVWTEPDERSNILLVPTKGGVMLQRRGPFLTELRPRNIVLQQELRPLEPPRRLGAITRFHFHLQRRNPDSPLEDDKGTKLIRIELIGLKNKTSSHP